MNKNVNDTLDSAVEVSSPELDRLVSSGAPDQGTPDPQPETPPTPAPETPPAPTQEALPELCYCSPTRAGLIAR